MAHSPLSDAVIVAYIERDTTVHENRFRDVMLKNLPASKTVWEDLLPLLDQLKDQSVEDTLHGAQIDNPGANTVTSLQREIRFHKAETHMFADEVVLYYVDGDSLDEAMAYMDTVGLLSHRLALLGTYLSDGNWDEADSSLAKLPLITVNDTAIYDLLDMMIDLGRDTLTILDISSADSTRVREIAADSTLDASVIAKGMLGILLDTMYVQNPEAFNLPSERRVQDAPEETIIASPTEATYFKAYPNPFNQQVTIAYNLNEECVDGCFLRLMDIQGRTVFEIQINASSGPNTVTFDLGMYETGIYVCSLYNNQRLLQTSRLVRIE